MTLQEYKKNIVLAKQADSKLLSDAGVLPNLLKILELIKNTGYSNMYNNVLSDIAQDKKTDFFGAFNSLIPERNWDDKDKLTKLVYILFRKAGNIRAGLKEGEIKPEIDEHFNVYERSLGNGNELYAILEKANPDIDSSSVFGEKQSKDYLSVVFKIVDYDIRTSYIANYSDNSYVHFVHGHEFNDSLMSSNANKYIRIAQYGREPEVRGQGDKVSNAIAITHEYYKKAKDAGYWDVSVDFNAEDLTQAIYQTTRKIRQIQNRENNPPILFTIQGKQYVFDLMDTFHVFVAMLERSPDETKTLPVKINSTTGELMVSCINPVKNMEGVEEFSFGILKPFDLSTAMLSYQEYGGHEESSNSLREKIKEEKKEEQKTLDVLVGKKDKEPLDELSENLNPEEFYHVFIQKCDEYIQSYATKQKCEGKDCYVPNGGDDYIKGPDGEYLTKKNGERFIDYNKVYSLRESFWINNPDFKVEDLIAFLISKGFTKNYDKISKEILGYSCAKYTEQLIDELIKNSYLCVEDIKLEGEVLKEIKYSFRADYTKGNFYTKIEKLIGPITLDETTEKLTDFGVNIKKYFGSEAGDVIISNQRKLLETESNRPLTYRLDDDKKDAQYKLELSADSYLIWEKFKQSAAYITPSSNPRTEFIAENQVYYQFWKWMQTDDAKSESIMAEFKDNVQELFDACVTPDGNNQYTVRYVFPNWTIRDSNGDLVLHPLILPKYEVFGTQSLRGKQQIVSKGFKQIELSATGRKGLRMWDGDSHYVKDMNPAFGEFVALNYKHKSLGTRSQGLKYFRYYNDPSDKESRNDNLSDADKKGATQARKNWEETCRQLIQSSKSVLARRKSKAGRVCNEMFNYWMKNFTSPEIRNKVQFEWNKKFNSLILPTYQKYPVFIRHSRYFADNKLFTFTEAQLEGIKSYVSRDNSLILGHDVGFGKTSGSIGAMSHLMETGEASRILVLVENNVFKKWIREISGDSDFIGLTPQINVVPLYNATPTALQGIKKYTEEEKKVMNIFKDIFLKKEGDFEIMLSKKDNDVFDVTVDTYEIIEKILNDGLPSYKTFNSFVNFISKSKTLFRRSLSKLNDLIRKEQQLVNKRIDALFERELSDKERDEKEKEIKDKFEIKKAKLTAEANKSLTSVIRRTIRSTDPLFWDDFGFYLPKVMKPNTIILGTHEALDKLRPDDVASVEAFSIIEDYHKEYKESRFVSAPKSEEERTDYIYDFKDDEDLCGRTNKNKEDLDVFSLPVSLSKLNIDAFVVDEIGNFNNIITTIRKRGIEKEKKSKDIQVRKLKPKQGTSKNRAVLQYYISAHGSKRLSTLNCLAVARTIQNNNKANGKQNNTMLLSATPFTDDPIYQMASVFSILNYDRLLKCGISGVFDLLNNFGCEEWKLDLTHKKEIGIFPIVDRYRNIAANSNLLHLFVNFKIRDAKIEAKRPKKYVLPDQHRSFVNIIKNCNEVNSYVSMNKYQLQAKELVLEVLHGTKTREQVLGRSDSTNVSENEHEKAIELGAEENIIEVNSIDELYGLKVPQGQVVKVTESDSHVFVELIGSDPSKPENWSEPRATIESEDIEVELPEGEEDSEEGDVNLKEADITSSVDSGNIDKKEVNTARTIICMGADTNISISPYIANIVGVNLPPLFKIANGVRVPDAKNFVENSPKLLYIVKCIKTVIEHHISRGEKISGQIIYLNRMKFKYENVDYYPLELLKEYMVSQNMGITEDEIAIIKGSTNKDIKSQIADRLNNGDVKVLIGTAAIKQGIDLQKNTSVLYIAQADYVPSTLMQVEGRAWRQGNEFKNIRVVYVMSHGSLDGFQFSKVNQKIGQIKKMLESTVFDMNTTQFTMDYNKMKLELETDLKKRAELEYELIAQEANEQLIRHSSQIETYKKIKKHIPDYLPKWEKFISKLNTIGLTCHNHGFEEARDALIKGPVMQRIKAEQKEARDKMLDAERESIKLKNQAAQEIIDADIKIEQDKLDVYNQTIANEIEIEEGKIQKLSPEKTWEMFSELNKREFLIGNKLGLEFLNTEFKDLSEDIKEILKGKNVIRDVIEDTVRIIKQGNPELKWNMFSEKNKMNFAEENSLPDTIISLSYSELPEEAKSKLSDKRIFDETINATIRDIKNAGKDTLINKGKEDEIISALRTKLDEETETKDVTVTDEQVKDFINGKYDTDVKEQVSTGGLTDAKEIWGKWTYTDRLNALREKSGYDEKLLHETALVSDYEKLDALTKNMVDEIVKKSTGSVSGRLIWSDWTMGNRNTFLAAQGIKDREMAAMPYDKLPDSIKEKLNVHSGKADDIKETPEHYWNNLNETKRKDFIFKRGLDVVEFYQFANLFWDSLGNSHTGRSLQSAVEEHIKSPNLFTEAKGKSWNIPPQFNYIELFPTSPFEQILDVVDAVKYYTRARIPNGKFAALSEESKEKWLPVKEVFEQLGYKANNNRTELYGEIYGENAKNNLPRHQRLYADGYAEFIEECKSFNLDTKTTTDIRTDKGIVVRNFYQFLNGDIKQLDVKISEIQDLIDKKKQEVGSPRERIEDIRVNLVREREKKSKQGAYDLDSQVEIFKSTNVLLQRRNDL